MNQKKVRALRKYILNNIEEVLILIRNEFGSKTEDMDARRVYQNAKRLYKQGKLTI